MLYAARINLIKELLDKLNLKTTDVSVFDEALTHPSFNFERNIDNAPDYERLEFLGDSVLRLVISSFLFDKYPKFDEGKLTKLRSYLVSDEFLAKLAINLEINKYINIGVHEKKDGGLKKSSILACTMEAIFGAIYLTLGFETAKKCINIIYSSVDIKPEKILFFYNSKEILQQYTQGKNKDLPVYEIVSEWGEAHNKMYESRVIYHGEELGRGVAGTKKESEKEAAVNALKKLKLPEGFDEDE